MPVYNLCRICLNEDANPEDMQPLFDDQNEDCQEILRKIEECGGIKLRPLQDFPSMLCYQCLDTLNVSYKFRVLCQASEHAFEDIRVKSEPDEEDKNSLHDQNEEGEEVIFDLQTEFITAEEIDFTEITEETDGGDHDDVDENEATDCEFLVESNDDSDYEPVEKTNRTKIKPKRGRRGRPRQSEVIVNIPKRKSMRVSGSGRGRKTSEETSTSIMCEICGNIYTKRGALNMHMRRHMEDKPFDCEICGKTFAGPSELNRHIRVHTGEKPFVCKYCGRAFADRSSNIRHERTHTNERPFSCTTCGKSFSYSNVLKNHMLTHTGEKPFICVPCNKTFSRKHQLDQHLGTLTHQQTARSREIALETVDINMDCIDE